MNQDIEHIETIVLQSVNTIDAWKYKVVPFKKTEKALSIYANTRSNKDELEIILGFDIEITLKENNFINQLLLKYYRKSDNTKKLKAKTEDLVYKIIEEAKESESSDIHIEILEDKARVRFRIDGKLQEKYILEKSTYPELVNKIKIKSKLQIAEKRLPQDGRMEYKNAHYNIDIRVSILPTLYGEKIVLRLLGTDAKNIHLQDLGMNELEKKIYLSGVDKSNGIDALYHSLSLTDAFMDGYGLVMESYEIIIDDIYDKDQVSYTTTINYNYTIQEGDNLNSLATKFNTSVSDLKKWNNLKDDKIKAGGSLKISKSYSAAEEKQ